MDNNTKICVACLVTENTHLLTDMSMYFINRMFLLKICRKSSKFLDQIVWEFIRVGFFYYDSEIENNRMCGA